MFNQCVVGFGCKLEKKTMVMEAKGGYKCSMLNGHEAVVENGVWIRPRILMLLPLTGKTVFQPFWYQRQHLTERKLQQQQATQSQSIQPEA